MTTKTLYLESFSLGTELWRKSESAPASANEVTSLKTGKVAAGNYFPFRPGVPLSTVYYATFTEQGSWRSELPYTGIFVSGNWTISYKLKNRAAYAHAGYLVCRIYTGAGAKMNSVDGQSALISFSATAGEIKTGTIAVNCDQNLVLGESGAEYLSIYFNWLVQTAGGNANAGVLFVCNEGNAEKEVTTDFSAYPALGSTPLSFYDKYVIQSTDLVYVTEYPLGDDTPAVQEFSLPSPKTVLVIYQASAPQSYYPGTTFAISVDGEDKALTWDSPYDGGYYERGFTFWVGTLGAGSHTIKGRVGYLQVGGRYVDNRILLIYILDGDEFKYIDDATPYSPTGNCNDPYALAAFAPTSNCKALVVYNAGRADITHSGTGTRHEAQIRAKGTLYNKTHKSAGWALDYPHSLSTLYAAQLTASENVVARGVIGQSGWMAIHRRQFAVLLFKDDTLLDTLTNDTEVSTTLAALQDDTPALIERSTSENRELLVVAVGTKAYVSSDVRGERYGIMTDGVDRQNSRGSPYDTADTNSAATCWAEALSPGSHSIRGRFSTNLDTHTAKISGRRIVALWLLGPSAVTETIVAKEFPMGYYQTTGVKELRSKVSGATLSKVSNDFPPILVKSGKSKELKSKWS